MKRAIVFLLLICQVAWAQSPAASPVPAAASAPTPEKPKAPENPMHQPLRDLRSKMQEAMNSGDIETLLSGVTDEVVFSTMNGDVVRGKDAIRDYFSKMMSGPDAMVKSVNTKFEADDLTVLYGGSLGDPEDAGVAFGHSTDSYVLRDGTKFTVNPRWTATMIREPDGWKVASFHYSVSMFDNPVLSKLKKSMGLVGGAGMGLGLLLGVLFGFVMGRRKRA